MKLSTKALAWLCVALLVLYPLLATGQLWDFWRPVTTGS